MGSQMKCSAVLIVQLVMVFSPFDSCLAGGNQQQLSMHEISRVNDAHRLVEQACSLETEVKDLKKQIGRFSGGGACGAISFDDLKMEIPENARSSSEKSNFHLEAEKQGTPVHMSQQDYFALLAKYREAMERYMKHRQLVQEHAVQYHNTQQQPVQDSNQQAGGPGLPFKLPEYKTLQLTVEDACEALQASESSLEQEETELFGMIQRLMAQKKSLPPSVYTDQWSALHQFATDHQSQCLSFDRAVLAKHMASSSSTQSLTHLAMLNGDYVEIQKAYSETQRKAALNHEEMKRADTHSKLAMMFLNELGVINPALVSASETLNSSPSTTEDAPDTIPLDQEFQEVQDLYKQVQQARLSNPVK